MPETRRSLLIDVCDPTYQRAWCQFADIYRSLIVRIAKIRGLQAEGLAQRVVARGCRGD
ncbi:MAG: hypothetical protein MPJ50_09445 [Pirellulales bacterium]|nr:hypothetical protein [Pirellulales bacterium]